MNASHCSVQGSGSDFHVHSPGVVVGRSPPVRASAIAYRSRGLSRNAGPAALDTERSGMGRLWRRGSKPAAWEARGWLGRVPRARIPGSGDPSTNVLTGQ